MKALMFDSETTGLKAEDGDKLIEVALITYDTETRKAIDKYIQRIDPECSISAGAQEVHGISYSQLVGKPKFAEIAQHCHDLFTQADFVVAHNLVFDATFFMYEFQACGLVLPTKPSIDTMTEARWACPDGKYPKLGELCFALRVPYDPAAAHSAEYDVEVMAQCLFKGADLGFYALPGGRHEY